MARKLSNPQQNLNSGSMPYVKPNWLKYEEAETDDFKNVIDKKIHQWLTDEKMRKFIRPITLFAPSHFENYLNEPEKPVTNYTWKPQ